MLMARTFAFFNLVSHKKERPEGRLKKREEREKAGECLSGVSGRGRGVGESMQAYGSALELDKCQGGDRGRCGGCLMGGWNRMRDVGGLAELKIVAVSPRLMREC